MADKAIISTKKLTAIADAIRGKNMSADTYTPDEMAAAISNIGTDDSSKIINSIIDGSITGIFNSEVTSIEKSTFYSRKQLTSANFPLVTRIGETAFYGCSLLTSVNFPLVTEVGNYAFAHCKALTSVNFPLVTKIITHTFWYCDSLTSVNFPLVTYIDYEAFYNCWSLSTVIIGTSELCELSSTSAFGETPIAEGTGYIYVADSLVDQYKAATNWSVFANQIKPISEYKEKEN